MYLFTRIKINIYHRIDEETFFSKFLKLTYVLYGTMSRKSFLEAAFYLQFFYFGF